MKHLQARILHLTSSTEYKRNNMNTFGRMRPLLWKYGHGKALLEAGFWDWSTVTKRAGNTDFGVTVP